MKKYQSPINSVAIAKFYLFNFEYSKYEVEESDRLILNIQSTVIGV
ncbi:MAG: hypothetical protein AAFO04_23100 [Cyanobacteria bacterium J06592_8]